MSGQTSMQVSELLGLEPRIKEIIPQISHEHSWDLAYVKAKRLGRYLVGSCSANKDTVGKMDYEAFIQYICGQLDKIDLLRNQCKYDKKES